MNVSVESRDDTFRINVKNKGQPSTFEAQVLSVEGPLETVRETWIIPWWSAPGQARLELKKGNTGILLVAKDLLLHEQVGNRASFVQLDGSVVWTVIGGQYGNADIAEDVPVRLRIQIIRHEPYRVDDRWYVLTFRRDAERGVVPTFERGDKRP